MKPFDNEALPAPCLHDVRKRNLSDRAGTQAVIAALIVAMVSGCADPGTANNPNPDNITTDTTGGDTSQPGQPSTTFASLPALQALQNDPLLLNDVPEPLSATLLTNTGLQVVYTSYIQEQIVDLDFIEQQWTLMVNCVDIAAVSPTLIIKDIEVLPLTLNDYVYLDTSGEPAATASPSPQGTTIQISMTDLDGTPQENGYALRNVFGEYLWESSQLPIDEYPAACALLSS